ncbi:adenosine deaminase [Parvularcula bermudensis HTCC2503]|uniref:adenosine deaminase n=1 Tax=Parvularcula bermudensis (strain ATCC BAA-594 / HTCC2503 / KCTC 12087) TaxID=314260 RepID=E0TCX8_PARBH|nr:adenosine deaminase [Parvularcula bermudensis]ADM10361.1 adenosine deaminase [Parvularcula bermudensis HTCC2503]
MRILLSVFALLAAGNVVSCGEDTRPTEATAAFFEEIRGDFTQGRAFLQAMPKGGDLHTHLPGAVYAESLIEWTADGAEDPELCYAAEDPAFVPCSQVEEIASSCSAGTNVRVSVLITDEDCRSAAIESFSVRNFAPSGKPGDNSGADHFFSTFDRFYPAFRAYRGESLAWIRETAALQNIVYVEPIWSLGIPIPAQMGVTETLNGETDADFAAYEEALMAGGMAELVSSGRALLAEMAAEADAILRCDSDTPAPGCAVAYRQLGAAVRTLPPELVFSQIMLHFMIAAEDPLSVGVNILAPEHAAIALRDYRLHMKMFAYFAEKYPEVGFTLHAGELWSGLTELEDMTYHIREAVDVARARRIGHGVGIGYETDAPALLQQMADQGVTVEINLTSNEVILGVKGDQHPITTYRQFGVPIVLSTDDEGVLRNDLTTEYQLAAERYDLSYEDLKTLSRQSLQSSFLPGAPLFEDVAAGRLISACRGRFDSRACRRFADDSEKARLQIDLERRFAAFEDAY